MSLFVFILTIFILVTFHEFGHYLFARLFKVKIIEFAIGFGPKVLKWHTKSNLWSIGIIPLGGYVKMLDEREGNVDNELKQFAFNNKPPLQKIIIAFAGPLFNIVFAFFAFYILAIHGVKELKPYIADVNPAVQTIESLTLMNRSTINQINHTPVYSWNDANEVLNDKLNKTKVIKFNYTTSDGRVNSLSVDLALLYSHYNNNLTLDNLGLSPVLFKPIISYIQPDSSAMKYGLKVGDQILSIDNVSYNNWYLLVEKIHNSINKDIILKIKRENNIIDIKLRPDTINHSGQLTGHLGIMPSIDKDVMSKSLYTKRYNWYFAIIYAYQETLGIMKLNYDAVINLIRGDMSLKDLGGPITIAKAGSGALSSSLNDYVVFLAIISIGLAFMNLLPIPVLDGGHILIYIIELIINKELSHAIQMQIFKFGFILIIGVSIFALYNDLLRL